MRVGVADAEVSEGHGYLGVAFGKTDPQFQMDLGFFVFTLPWLTFVIAYLSMALVIGALVAACTHYVSGGLHFQWLHYVEPIYVQAKSASAYPLNRAVIAAYGDKLAWSTTLDGALDALFGGNAGASSGDNTPTSPTTPPGLRRRRRPPVGQLTTGPLPPGYRETFGADPGPHGGPEGAQRRRRRPQGGRLHQVRRGPDPAQGRHRCGRRR